VDADAASKTISVGCAVKHGSVVINGCDLKYIPNPNFVGTDTICYTVCDDKGACVDGKLIVTITNAAPVAQTD